MPLLDTPGGSGWEDPGSGGEPGPASTQSWPGSRVQVLPGAGQVRFAF